MINLSRKITPLLFSTKPLRLLTTKTNPNLNSPYKKPSFLDDEYDHLSKEQEQR